jgi:predicted glutamine amidotransferase
VFLAILGAGAETDPVAATMRTLGVLTDMVRASGTTEPLRFTSALSDGENLYAFRYSNNDTPNTLYYRESADNVVIVSEPLDTDRSHWKAVPQRHLIVARAHGPVELRPFPEVVRVAAE